MAKGLPHAHPNVVEDFQKTKSQWLCVRPTRPAVRERAMWHVSPTHRTFRPSKPSKRPVQAGPIGAHQQGQKRPAYMETKWSTAPKPWTSWFHFRGSNQHPQGRKPTSNGAMSNKMAFGSQCLFHRMLLRPTSKCCMKMQPSANPKGMPKKADSMGHCEKLCTRCHRINCQECKSVASGCKYMYIGSL